MDCFALGGVQWNVAEPWRLARKQYEFFSSRGNGYVNGEVLVINSVDEIEPTIRAASSEGKPIRTGDLMYFVSNGNPHHATIVSLMDNHMIYYAANTDSWQEKKLCNGLGDESVYVVRMNDSNW